MAKRDTLRQKLKAADRRRQRRSAESPPAEQTGPTVAPETGPSETGPTEVDVVGLIVRAILDHAESLGQEARDAIVIAALKASLNATVPNGQHARQLLQQLERIPSQPGISLRVFRDALQQLLSHALATQDPRSNDAFLRYLGIIAD